MKKVLFLIHDMGQGGAEKVLVNLVFLTVERIVSF